MNQAIVGRISTKASAKFIIPRENSTGSEVIVHCKNNPSTIRTSPIKSTAIQSNKSNDKTLLQFLSKILLEFYRDGDKFVGSEQHFPIIST